MAGDADDFDGKSIIERARIFARPEQTDRYPIVARLNEGCQVDREIFAVMELIARFERLSVQRQIDAIRPDIVRFEPAFLTWEAASWDSSAAQAV